MDENENTFPMDVTDPSSRPRNFQPDGYLVVMLAGTEEGQRAEAALVAEGFSPRDLKLYTGKQILDNHKESMGEGCHEQGGGFVGRRPGGSGTLPKLRADDRSALWLRLPREADVRKALRVLADYDYLHTRFYGSKRQTDFHIS